MGKFREFNLFNLGDEVKFTDYAHHEYVHHVNETAIVLEQTPGGDYLVQWIKDGRQSLVWRGKDYWGMYLIDDPVVTKKFKALKAKVTKELQL